MARGKQLTPTSQPRCDMRVNAYLEEHNDWIWADDPEDWDDDMYGSCLPVTQGGFADTYISEHTTYQGLAFRGNLWETTFGEERLVKPNDPANRLSPEALHHHPHTLP